MGLDCSPGDFFPQVELGNVSIVAKGEDAGLGEVLAEELLGPEDAILRPCSMTVAEQAVDEDNAWGVKMGQYHVQTTGLQGTANQCHRLKIGWLWGTELIESKLRHSLKLVDR